MQIVFKKMLDVIEIERLSYLHSDFQSISDAIYIQDIHVQGG